MGIWVLLRGLVELLSLAMCNTNTLDLEVNSNVVCEFESGFRSENKFSTYENIFENFEIFANQRRTTVEFCTVPSRPVWTVVRSLSVRVV